MKRLKNSEDKTDKQLNEDKDSQLGVKSIGYTVKQKLLQEAKHVLEKLNNQEKLSNYKKLSFKRVDYDFTNFSSLRELFRLIYYGEISIPVAEREQNDSDAIFKLLKNYKPRTDSKYKTLKDDILINAQNNFYDGREMAINAFKNIFKKLSL